MSRIHERKLPWLIKEFSVILTVTQCCSVCGVSKLMEELQSAAQQYQFNHLCSWDQSFGLSHLFLQG